MAPGWTVEDFVQAEDEAATREFPPPAPQPVVGWTIEQFIQAEDLVGR
jgi:hypothetical protein